MKIKFYFSSLIEYLKSLWKKIKPKEPEVKSVMKFSLRGYDFDGKPLSLETKTDDCFAYWGNKIYFIGEKSKGNYYLYIGNVKTNEVKYSYSVPFKNIILARVEKVQK